MCWVLKIKGKQQSVRRQKRLNCLSWAGSKKEETGHSSLRGKNREMKEASGTFSCLDHWEPALTGPDLTHRIGLIPSFLKVAEWAWTLHCNLIYYMFATLKFDFFSESSEFQCQTMKEIWTLRWACSNQPLSAALSTLLQHNTGKMRLQNHLIERISHMLAIRWRRWGGATCVSVSGDTLCVHFVCVCRRGLFENI